MDEWYDAEADAAKQLKFQTQTAGQSLTAQQPLNNFVRVTVQAMAAVLGGTQSLHTTARTRRWRSRARMRFGWRCGASRSWPRSRGGGYRRSARGSFAVESLTEELAAEIMAYLEEIREMGDGSVRDGVLAGIEQGYFHREIQEASYEYQQRVDAGEEVVGGVNDYRIDEKPAPDILQVDSETRDRQLTWLEQVKEERDDAAVGAAFEAVGAAIEVDENVMPPIIDAVKVYATMGEIMQVFEAHHGAYQEKVGLA
jgi:methylmalonyl-CoA mutase N-terminal domain/subunit